MRHVCHLIDRLLRRCGFGAQRKHVFACLAGALYVRGDAGVLLHRASERLKVTPEAEAFVDGRRPQLGEGFSAEGWARSADA